MKSVSVIRIVQYRYAAGTCYFVHSRSFLSGDFCVRNMGYAADNNKKKQMTISKQKKNYKNKKTFE